VEFYESGRYLTVTGQRLAGCQWGIERRPAELAKVHAEVVRRHAEARAKAKAEKMRATKMARDGRAPAGLADDELIERIRASKQGDLFAELYDRGDTGRYSGDDSAADFALLGILAFWTGRDAARMEALFDQSALAQRDKWCDRADYRELSINAAIDGCTEVYTPRASRNGPVAGTGSKSSKGQAAAKKPPPESQSQVLLRLAAAASLFHDPGGRAYASGPVGQHREVHAVRSPGFGLWLKHRFYIEKHRPPSAEAYQDAMGIIESQAMYDGPEEPVFIRVAGDPDRIIIDLGDPDWRAVVITSDGWNIMNTSPVRFRRPKGMRPMPLPVRGGSIGDLKSFLNCDSNEFDLVVGWLAAALRPSGPYPLPILIGEAGSAKTTVAKIFRLLIDPHKMPLRGHPKDERDLMVAAHNIWLIALDNLSVVYDWLSDALCRLATGGGFGARTLYSDDEETVLEAQRPAILTGIADFARREDLIDRAIFLHLPPHP
jgi:hypothetical protein